ncbi:hypothetical protein PYCCODRAFT_1204268 [Trametes coccinea BRFM310]|uniref:Uncharacterized protein n=1 Tax=Trametes coccinea (strain BRFM310) TaxID=1353009 RepID=A0A1Y2I9L1_TRAC3|nr:hypothetical protein PYCCODRAFT_1204268 [Trametes coccinea BRFM310]
MSSRKLRVCDASRQALPHYLLQERTRAIQARSCAHALSKSQGVTALGRSLSPSASARGTQGCRNIHHTAVALAHAWPDAKPTADVPRLLPRFSIYDDEPQALANVHDPSALSASTVPLPRNPPNPLSRSALPRPCGHACHVSDGRGQEEGAAHGSRSPRCQCAAAAVALLGRVLVVCISCSIRHISARFHKSQDPTLSAPRRAR